MASSYNRKSDSSASRRPTSRSASGSRSSKGASSRPRSNGGGTSRTRSASYEVVRGSKRPTSRADGARPLTSVRVGDAVRDERSVRAERSYRRYLVRIGAALAVAAVLLVAAVAVYFSDLFTIESVSVSGVEHLTTADMEQLAGVPEGTTLLRVDTAAIKESLLRDSWVADVAVKRAFPNTLEIVVTERTIAAVVEVPSEDASTTVDWAIASDGMWLMSIPDEDSEEAAGISSQVYEDAATVLRITDVAYGVDPQVGDYCSDDSVNNALDIVSGMTTELADEVVSVLATDTASTTLVLDSGVEIVFGEAEDIRSKERVCLEILEEYDDVVYINVRTVSSPTWRAVS